MENRTLGLKLQADLNRNMSIVEEAGELIDLASHGWRTISLFFAVP